MDQAGKSDELNVLFTALADPTRRAILTRLAGGEASVGDLASQFPMSQPAISKHLKMLERAGLVTRGVDRQRRPVRLNAAPMAEAVAYLEHFRDHWGARLDHLDDLLTELQKKETRDD
jgi:DNA-binding transcriptional ArsR family regulator